MKTLALCAILGNEEKTVERFLRTFAPLVDTFCLVFAVGSQPMDSTFSICRRVLEELGKPVEYQIYTNRQAFPHVDHFGNARQMSWEMGEKTGHDWICWFDCDDLISPETTALLREAMDTVDKDVLLVPYEVQGKKQIVLRERFVRNNGTSKWKYPIHEILTFNREVTFRALHKAPTVHAPLWDRPANMGRNENILLSHVEDAARNFLHLHIAAFDLGNGPDALKWGHAALHAPGLDDGDRYEVLLNLAQLGTSPAQCRALAAEAFELMPDRREALALLVNFDIFDKDFYRAEKRAHLMMGIPKPPRSYWRLNHEWYDWKGLYLYSNALRRVGKLEEAKRVEDKFLGDSPTFTIVHPTYMRPEQAMAVRELWLSCAENPLSVEYIFGLHHDDKKSLDLLSGFRHEVTDKEGCSPNTLSGFRVAKGKFVMCVADDLFPFPGWDTAVLKKLEGQDDLVDLGDDDTVENPWYDQKIVLNFSDGVRQDKHICHSWMTRPWLEEFLKDPWPGTGIYSDNEFTYRAYKAGVVLEAFDLFFEHRHPIVGKAKMDATYEDQNQIINYTEGLKLFRERNPDASI